MADYSYILFNKTPSQLRLLGACGGRAYGRNRRKRLAQMPPAPAATIPGRAKPRETTAKAIARLDTLFPWLRDANRPRQILRLPEAAPQPPLPVFRGRKTSEISKKEGGVDRRKGKPGKPPGQNG